MSDKQEDDLKRAFAEAADTAPDDQAKQRAMEAALAAFDQAQEKNAGQDQGSADPARPISEPTEKGRKTMSQQIMKWSRSSVAAASLLVAVAVVWTWQGQLNEVVVLPDTGALMDEAEVKSEPLMEGYGSATGQSVADRRQEVAPARTREMAEEVMPATAPPPVLAEADMMASGSAGPMASFIAPSTAEIAADPMPRPGYQDEGRDDFTNFEDNPVHRVTDEPVSTFAVDVDTASYSFVRRQLNYGLLPQPDAVRVEEIINYFDYAYPLPDSRDQPFDTHVQVMDSPWNGNNKLLHIGIQGYELAREARPRTNLVFLLDVSGSMDSPDKLPLVKQSLNLLLDQLGDDDHVAIAVYAGAAGTVLAPTPASDRRTIRAAMERLQAGGSTAGGEGIRLAYQLARESFDGDAVNRVILATDGDFNVGITDHDELQGFIERQREEGIYLSVLGFGEGNYHDSLMQTLAQNGNGIAAYIDTLGEAQKVLVEEATSALFPIANDVKIQVHFNPATVSEYRLIGYETRALSREDFNNDQVDAGDIGAGHSVTAIYEFTPVGESGLIEPGRYEETAEPAAEHADEYAFVRLRYKLPGESDSILLEQPVAVDGPQVSELLQREARFATAVAGFAQLLRGGRYTGDWDYDDALALAQANKGEDEYGYRTELVQLIRKAKTASAM